MSLLGELPIDKSGKNAFSREQHSTTFETLSAAVETAGMDAFGNTLVQNITRAVVNKDSAAMGLEKLSVEELKKQYPDVEENFTEPQYPLMAQKTAESLRKRRALEEVIAGGPDTWAAKTGQFGASLWGTITDPGELALQVGTMGIARAVRLPTMLAKAFGAKTVMIPGVAGEAAGYGVAAATGVVENLPTTAISELSRGMNLSAEGEEYTAADFITATIEGTVMGVGFEVGLHAGKGAYGAFRRKVLSQIEGSMIEQVNSGIRPNAEPAIREHIVEMSNNGNGQYVHRPVQPDTKFYMASDTAASDFARAVPVVVGDHIGDGIYLTDNQFAANGMAASKSSSVSGTMFKFDNPNLNLANYNDVFPESMKLQVTDVLKEAGILRKIDIEHETAISVLEQLRDAKPRAYLKYMQKIQEIAKASGFDGVTHTADRIAGREAVSPQNVINIFDKEKLTPGEALPSDRSLVPKVNADDMKAEFARAEDPSQKITASRSKRPPLEDAKIEAPRLQERVKNAEQGLVEKKLEFEEAVNQGLIPEAEAKMLEEIFKDARLKASREEEFAEKFVTCLVRS